MIWLWFDQRLTTIQLQFDHTMTILWPTSRPSAYLCMWATALRPEKINRPAWLQLADCVTVTLMTFNKQSNARRMAIKWKSIIVVTTALMSYLNFLRPAFQNMQHMSHTMPLTNVSSCLLYAVVFKLRGCWRSFAIHRNVHHQLVSNMNDRMQTDLRQFH